MVCRCCGGLRSSVRAGHSGLSLSPSVCISSCPAPWCVCVVLLHLSDRDTEQRTESHWNSSASWRKACAGLSPCSGTGGKRQSALPHEKGLIEFYFFFKFYINYVVPFESSLIQTHKCSQSRTWMFFPAVSDLPPSVLLLRHCGTWHPFHVKQLKGDT